MQYIELIILFVIVTLCASAALIYTIVKRTAPATFCIFTFYVFCVAVIGHMFTSNNADTAQVEEDLLKTVAHLDLSERDDLELVAIDYPNDVAYYRYIMPERNVKVGDTVYLFNDIEASLVSVDAVGFTFECDEVIEAGMSGTAVLNSNGDQIGYISSRLDNGKYYCVWS